MGLPFKSRGEASAASLTPGQIANLAAWYDVSSEAGTTSNLLRIDASNRVSLIADRSGNSGTNCLCLNGAAGQYASVPDAAPVRPSSELELVVRVSCPWTDANDYAFVAKYGAAGNRSFIFRKTASGALQLNISTDGTAIVTATSTANVAFSDYVKGWVKVTWRASDGRTQFFTAADSSSEPVSFSQLGANVTIASGSNIFNSTAVVEFGSRSTGTLTVLNGNLFQAILRRTIGGATDCNPNFALASKLATSFTESSSNAATVTINSSGDLGARICGERDLVQLTLSKQPIYTAATATTPAFITFDGSDDYMKASAFSLSQPETVYFVGQQVSWTANDYFFDGNTTNGGAMYQLNASPQINIYAGTGTPIGTTALQIGTTGIFTSLFNGASSLSRVNRLAATTGSIGTNGLNGFTLGAGQTAPTGFGNIRTNEVAIYAAAHDTATQDRFALAMGRKWGFSV